MLELRAYPSADGRERRADPASCRKGWTRARPSERSLSRVRRRLAAHILNERAGEYLRFLGRNRDELLGQSVWDVIPGLSGSRFQAEAFRAVVEQREVEFDSFFAPMNRWFSVRLTPTNRGIVACARDMTTRSRPSAERPVPESTRPGANRRFQQSGRVDRRRGLSARHRRAMRQPLRPLARARRASYPEQFIGRTTRDILGADNAPVHERANLRALAGETVTYEWILSTARGPRHVLNTISPLRDPNGVITGIVVSVGTSPRASRRNSR